jgi:hypothetical protein
VSDSALDKVRQWELSGGIVRLVSLTSDRLVVELCTCTGEPMEQLQSDDPDLVAYAQAAPLAPEAARERSPAPGQRML